MVKCPNCSSEIPEDSIYCKFCGTRQGKYATEEFSVAANEVLKRVQEAEVGPLRTLRPQIYQRLEHTILRALRRNAGERQQSARELADELDAVIAEAGVKDPQGLLTGQLLKSTDLGKTRGDLGVTSKKPGGEREDTVCPVGRRNQPDLYCCWSRHMDGRTRQGRQSCQ
jgi:hypothetical protein